MFLMVLAATSSLVDSILGIENIDPVVKILIIALVVGINGITLAVITLSLWWRKSYQRIEKQLDERDRDRAKLSTRIADLERQSGLINAVANCGVVKCPFRDAAAATHEP